MNSGRVTTSMVQRNVLADLNSLSAKLARTQAKAASGKEITRPSDDPFATAKAMGMRQAMDANTQYKDNIDNAVSWQDATETALSSIGDGVKLAHDLIVQGASDTADPESRKIAPGADVLLVVGSDNTQ